MRTRLLTLVAFTGMAGYMTMTDPFTLGGVRAAQADPLLIAAAETGDTAGVRKMLGDGVPLEGRDDRGRSALLAATHANRIETARLLIEAEAAVNALGWTALLEAIILSDGGPRHVRIVRLLVDAGADVSLADNDAVTPMQHARARGHREIAEILEKAGAK